MSIKNINYPLPYIIPNLEDWPLAKLARERDAFMEEVLERTLEGVMRQIKQPAMLSEQLAKVVYMERDRLIQNPWAVDPPDEMDFWADVRQQLLRGYIDQDEQVIERVNRDLLERILRRYIQEITGQFKTTTYRFARRALPMGFNVLLNTANFFYKGSKEKLHITGEVPHIRSLMEQGGTIVLVPTHFSNLDSILIGWASDRIGLSAFSYGAGLNLYNTPALAYFFSRLGAYALDRRKKNNLYLETLKSFSQATLERGVHTLFFPGGTRSRSGQLENKLKRGLLGTTIDAQYRLYERGENTKLYIVPVVLNYHFVLEAKSLIDQYLQQTGKELYLVEKKAFGGAWNLLKFMWKFFSAGSEILVNYGRPLDVLGNFVDEQGESLDQQGRRLDLREYFMSNGQLNFDRQRHEEYTKMLADTIVTRYYTENIVLSSQLLAFTAFRIFEKQYPKLDFYGLLRLPADDRVILHQVFERNLEKLCGVLRQMEAQGKIQLSEQVRQTDVQLLIQDGLANIGTYHVKKALIKDADGDISTEDMNLLYYYHNRLDGYGLDRYIEVEEHSARTGKGAKTNRPV